MTRSLQASRHYYYGSTRREEKKGRIVWLTEAGGDR
jgi:hypothetical protein